MRRLGFGLLGLVEGIAASLYLGILIFIYWMGMWESGIYLLIFFVPAGGLVGILISIFMLPDKTKGIHSYPARIHLVLSGLIIGLIAGYIFDMLGADEEFSLLVIPLVGSVIGFVFPFIIKPKR